MNGAARSKMLLTELISQTTARILHKLMPKKKRRLQNQMLKLSLDKRRPNKLSSNNKAKNKSKLNKT